MPRRMSAWIGPTPSELSPVPLNDGNWHPIVTPHYEGRVSFHVNGFVDEHGNAPQSPYFDFSKGDGRKAVTWSIQSDGKCLSDLVVLDTGQDKVPCHSLGRILTPMPASELHYALCFDKPLNLPWGCK